MANLRINSTALKYVKEIHGISNGLPFRHELFYPPKNSQLRHIYDKELLLDGGVISNKYFWERKGNLSVETCYDLTEFECIMNKVRLSDFKISPEHRMFTSFQIAALICSKNPNLELVQIIDVCDDGDVVHRFHRKRTSASWLHEDLELYREPTIVIS